MGNTPHKAPEASSLLLLLLAYIETDRAAHTAQATLELKKQSETREPTKPNPSSEMARLHHLSLLLLLLLLPVLAAAASAADQEHDIKISVQYPTEEEARWLDRWSEKYQAQGSASGFSVHPATAEESAYLNSIFSDGKKRAAAAAASGGGARAGFDGHIEFDDDDHPFGRIVVDTVHSRASSSAEPNDSDDLLKQNHESHSHAEYDNVKDL